MGSAGVPTCFSECAECRKLLSEAAATSGATALRTRIRVHLHGPRAQKSIAKLGDLPGVRELFLSMNVSMEWELAEKIVAAIYGTQFLRRAKGGQVQTAFKAATRVVETLREVATEGKERVGT